MNFFDPRIEVEGGRLYTQVRYDQIVEEQTAISYASKGGVTIADTDEMCPYDRGLVLKSIMKIKEAEAEAQEKAMNPRLVGSTSRFRK